MYTILRPQFQIRTIPTVLEICIVEESETSIVE